MIGVAASADDLEIAREFFELFKTPWEPAVPGRQYRVILSDREPIEELTSDVFLVYGSRQHPADAVNGSVPTYRDGLHAVRWGTETFPVYGGVGSFEDGAGFLVSKSGPVDRRYAGPAGSVHRIGYDLFGEVRHLLTQGQPVEWASKPTLELHIQLLRHLLLDLGLPFVEVPPRPSGHEFICCLTHDLDFFGIRRHGFDRTLAGFVARASVGTFVGLFRRRRRLSDALRNWVALVTLPLVFLRVLPDFWRPFDDYAVADGDHRATFFLVPFKGTPGVGPDGIARPARAVSYQVSEIREEACEAASRGHELAVHGIDAWRDANRGEEELAELADVAGIEAVGTRMHWLYFDEQSPSLLERAGYAYDSTWGYNDAVGYRAGTSQVFQLRGTVGLMELPMSIMDSAMFFPDRMDLGAGEALACCRTIIGYARRFGGTVVINWHDRSVVPERLWGQCYAQLLSEIETPGRVWFVTARRAVEWYRWRRSIRFSQDAAARVTVEAAHPVDGLPGARIVVHKPAGEVAKRIEEHPFDGTRSVSVAV